MDIGGSGEVLTQLLAKVEQLEAANERLADKVRILETGAAERAPVGALDEPDQAVSRRGMLKKAGGVLAAGVAGAGVVGALAAQPAAAANGNAVILGSGENKATDPTGIQNGQNSVYLNSVGGGGYGVLIRDYDFYGAGVVAYVYGEQGRALEGTTSGRADQTAVLADTRNGAGLGLGLRALTKGGTAVRAEATSGLALDVKGTTKFSLSGLATIARGQTTKTVNASIREVSLVLATVQGEVAGTWVQSVARQVGNGRFIIHLNKPAPAELKVGWFVVN